MKTICILTYERTGSGWLCDILNGEKSISVHEIFSEDPLLLIVNIQKVFAKIYKVDEKLLKTLYKIYNPDNFFIDSTTYRNIKAKILNQDIYDISLFDILQKKCYDNNFNFIFKLFPQHIKNNNLQQILEKVDLIIINYRKSVLDTFISLEIANKTNIWYSQQKRYSKEIKIKWNANKYKNYYDSIENKISFFKKICLNKNHIVISYEDIHEKIINFDLKIQYLNKKLEDLGLSIPLNTKELFKKQNTTIYKNIFENYDEFYSSIKDLSRDIDI